MTHGLRPRLTIPKLLAVSALGLVTGCPGDDQSDDTGPSMTTGATAADSTSGATETDTGALPDCQANADKVACEATMSCQWLPEVGGCIIDCTIIEDEVTCTEQVGCFWYGDFCNVEPIA